MGIENTGKQAAEASKDDVLKNVFSHQQPLSKEDLFQWNKKASATSTAADSTVSYTDARGKNRQMSFNTSADGNGTVSIGKGDHLWNIARALEASQHSKEQGHKAKASDVAGIVKQIVAANKDLYANGMRDQERVLRDGQKLNIPKELMPKSVVPALEIVDEKKEEKKAEKKEEAKVEGPATPVQRAEAPTTGPVEQSKAGDKKVATVANTTDDATKKSIEVTNEITRDKAGNVLTFKDHKGQTWRLDRGSMFNRNAPTTEISINAFDTSAASVANGLLFGKTTYRRDGDTEGTDRIRDAKFSVDKGLSYTSGDTQITINPDHSVTEKNRSATKYTEKGHKFKYDDAADTEIVKTVTTSADNKTKTTIVDSEAEPFNFGQVTQSARSWSYTETETAPGITTIVFGDSKNPLHTFVHDKNNHTVKMDDEDPEKESRYARLSNGGFLYKRMNIVLYPDGTSYSPDGTTLKEIMGQIEKK